MEEKKSNPVQKPGRKGSWVKRIGVFLLAAFVIMQFIQPGKNNQSMDMTHDISKVVAVPENVQNILKTSCSIAIATTPFIHGMPIFSRLDGG